MGGGGSRFLAPLPSYSTDLGGRGNFCKGRIAIFPDRRSPSLPRLFYFLGQIRSAQKVINCSNGGEGEKTHTMIEQHYSPKQLADLLSVSPMTISRMVKAGKFEVVRCGHRVIIPESAVLRYLDANRIKVKGDIPLGSTSQAPSKLLESTFQQPPRRGRRPLISYL